MNIPLARPSVDEADIERAVNVLRSGMLVQGRYVADFEQKLADRVGVKHAVAVTNGTATLHLSLVALGIGAGDEVVIPALSYVATANVVELTGARSVFVDIDPRTCNLDPERLEGAITDRTRAIMPVHEFGRAADMERIGAIAEAHGLPVIEDAACAIGAESGGRPVGAIGRTGSFSFHPRKSITSGEGGAIVTNDDALSERLRTLRNHGLADGACVEPGYNCRMTDIQAALLIGQLDRLDGLLARRQAIAELYHSELAGLPLERPPIDSQDKVTWQSYHVLLDPAIDRAALFAALNERGIGVNYGAQCIPTQPYYARTYGYGPADFPHAQAAFDRGMVLPLFDELDDASVREVASTLHSLLA